MYLTPPALAVGSVKQETTLAGHRTLATVKRALEAGYHIRLYYVGLDTVEESLSRIASRVARGGHNIPSEDVQRRFSGRFADVAHSPLLPRSHLIRQRKRLYSGRRIPKR